MNSIIKPKVVFDTNVYISAIISSGIPRKVLELAQKGRFELMVSDAILAEIRRVMQFKLKRPEWQVDTIISTIKNISDFISPKINLSVIKNHDPDNRILECAVEGHAQYLVSGDLHHILPLGKYEKITIISPSDFLRIMEKF